MAKLRQYKKGLNTKLTDNFSSSEFDCKCKYSDCKWTIIDLDHIEKLQELRDKIKAPIKVNSGYRCEKHNKDVGGVAKSRHKEGDASDIVSKNLSPDKLAEECEKLGFSGIGRYDTFTHVDSRGYKARWNFKKK